MSKHNIPPWLAYKFIVWINKKLENLQKKLMPTPMRIMKSLGGHYSVQVIYSGIKLKIFDSLLEQPKSLDEISGELSLDQSSLFRLMRALVALGVIKKNQEGRYKLSKTGIAVSKQGDLRYQALMMGSEWYDGFSRLHESVKSGKKELNKKFNGEFFEYIKEDHELANNFNGSMNDLTQACIPAILAEYDFSGNSNIIDVGGGNGLFLSAILEKHKEAKGVLFDMDAVIESSTVDIQKAVSNDRCELVSGDFFNSVPEGGDLYILKFILHDWSDEKAMTILENCRKSMKKGTKLILIEFLIEDEEDHMMRIYLDLLMMVMFDGKERDVLKFKEMLNSAGFKFNKVLNTRSFANVIEAEAI
jgi:predicted transcriptional regulator